MWSARRWTRVETRKWCATTRRQKCFSRNDELAKRLAFVISLQVGDAQSVLVQLPDIIADYLASGRTVNIKGLGNFFPSITSEPVERIEDCTADKVRISRICFRAAGSFMQRVCRHLDLFSFQVQELKKELKKK